MSKLVARFRLNESEPLRANFSLTEDEPIVARFSLLIAPSKLSQLENDVGFKNEDEILDLIRENTSNLNYRRI